VRFVGRNVAGRLAITKVLDADVGREGADAANAVSVDILSDQTGQRIAWPRDHGLWRRHDFRVCRLSLRDSNCGRGKKEEHGGSRARRASPIP
jgi:hypothetical protein